MEILADHTVLLAIPAFVPALALVGVIVVIAVRDRRSEARKDTDDDIESRSEEKEFQ
ncbi:hypothetical protein [Nocardia sp. NBC_01009]|uniref:hypothetical protein n=1 Tax=Nocardia sp. NBC_01009 TaxID=2975996 RepID=UPI0038667013|nr:hypothetical protein OHA42_19270 [Nocardia sp. NBC_01009]